MLEARRRRCSFRSVLYPVLVLSSRLRLGVLASAVPLPVPELRVADNLECKPGIIRLREMPAPDADEAESGGRLMAISTL